MTGTISLHDIHAGDSSLQPLMDYVISATGLMYYADRRREFATHVASRLDVLQLHGCSAYLQLLQNEPSGNAELDRLIALLTIGETHFFRHRELFKALEHTVFPNLIEKNRQRRRLRIWSAGCSIGAEAYSISMLLRRRFAASLPGWDIRIIGTDINRDFLTRASAGHFEDWALRAVSAEDRDAFFSHDGKRWTIKPLFQQGVSFEYHNLASPQFASPLGDAAGFDLILCRNVMIYFSQDVVRQSIENLHGCLSSDGWLVVGHAEHNLNWFRSFRTLMSDGAVLYQNQAAQPADAEASTALQVDAFDPGENASTPVRNQPPLPRSDIELCRSDAPCDDQNPSQELRSLADRGELQEALCRCQALQRSDTRDPTPHFYQALILQQSDDDSGAEQAFKRAIYLDRNHLLAHYYLGLLLQKQRRSARAARCFHNVVELSSGRSADEPIADVDELTVADLQSLSLEHLSVLEQT